MGIFDSVMAACPKCGEQVEFQSKAGDCVLREYRIDSVPPEIARDVAGDEVACTCGYVLRLALGRPIERVCMVVEDGAREPSDDQDTQTRYRLLTCGDIVARGDEWLQDDAVTWEPTPAWAVGMRYARGPMTLPVRRKC